jgi:hypothetical protein
MNNFAAFGVLLVLLDTLNFLEKFPTLTWSFSTKFLKIFDKIVMIRIRSRNSVIAAPAPAGSGRKWSWGYFYFQHMETRV